MATIKASRSEGRVKEDALIEMEMLELSPASLGPPVSLLTTVVGNLRSSASLQPPLGTVQGPPRALSWAIASQGFAVPLVRCQRSLLVAGVAGAP